MKIDFNAWLTRFGNAVKTLPTTNARIAADIAAFLVAISVWLLIAIAHSFNPTAVALWEPSGNMIMFILGMAGIDSAHFFGKRKSEFRPDVPDADDTPAPPGTPAPPAN